VAFRRIVEARSWSVRDLKRMTPYLPFAGTRLWPAMTHPVVGCMACQFDRQVYGIEIELV
jgi:hypothetical protein